MDSPEAARTLSRLRRFAGRVVAITLLVGPPAPLLAQSQGEHADPNGAKPSHGEQADSDSSPAPTSDQSLDFDLFPDDIPDAAPAVDEAFTHKVHLRHRMLTVHQAMGLTTLSLMIATTVVGTLNYQDIYAPDGAGTGNYLVPHRILGYATTASFAATGGLALFAPEGYKKHSGFDTASVHKIAVSGATLGMLTQVALGFVAARTQEAGNPSDVTGLARIHQISGFVTTACLATAATVWIF